MKKEKKKGKITNENTKKVIIANNIKKQLKKSNNECTDIKRTLLSCV